MIVLMDPRVKYDRHGEELHKVCRFFVESLVGIGTKRET